MFRFGAGDGPHRYNPEKPQNTFVRMSAILLALSWVLGIEQYARETPSQLPRQCPGHVAWQVPTRVRERAG